MRALIPSESDPSVARHISPTKGLKLVDVAIPEVGREQVTHKISWLPKVIIQNTDRF